MTKELKPKQPKNKNKCPFGHKWNKDVDETLDCTYCDKWEDCHRDNSEVFLENVVLRG